MAVVVAERGGLHAAATRFACSGGLSAEVRAAWQAALAVEARMLAASRAGATLRRRAAARATTPTPRPGIRGAWREHYQGGPIAYRQREFEIVPQSAREPLVRAARSSRATRSPGIRASPAAASPRTRTSSSDGRPAAASPTPASWPQVAVADGRPRHRDPRHRDAEARREGRRRARAPGARAGAAAAAASAARFPDGAALPRRDPERRGRARARRRSCAAPSERGIVVNRVSQGIGAMLLGESELREMAAHRRRGRHRGLALHGPARGLRHRRARALGRRRRALRPGARRARPALRGRGHRARLRGRHPQLPDRRCRAARRADGDAATPASCRATASGRSR